MPVIYHGHTLTTKIPFKVRRVMLQVVQCVRTTQNFRIRDVIANLPVKKEKKSEC